MGSLITDPRPVVTRVSLILQNVSDGLHNGSHAASICQSHPKKSEFYLHFLPLALHIGGAVGAYEKTAQKWPKKYRISKLAETHPKVKTA